MIKYLGSKRTMIPLLSRIAAASEAKTALDLFTGTTRVARAFKGLGIETTAVDVASYSEVFAKTWIELDKDQCDLAELSQAIDHLNGLKPSIGYFTEKFCLEARYFQPKNGEKVDAMREAIELEYQGTWLYEPLLTALILSADRVDSTTGLQMAFLKNWSRRSHTDLALRNPELLAGRGHAIRGDAIEVAKTIPAVELAYLDPPYNQHRYFSNYHIWESLVRWDKPDTYGIANKRVDARDSANKSPFNSRKTNLASLEKVIAEVNCEIMMLSYNNESWLDRDLLIDICREKGHVELIDIDFRRYIGSTIGIYNKKGQVVGTPAHKRNLEHLVLAGPKDRVQRMVAAAASV